MDVKTLKGLKDKIQSELLAKPFVKSIGIGLADPNNLQSEPTIVVYTDSSVDFDGFIEFEKHINTFQVEGNPVPIRIENVGPFYANGIISEPFIADPVEVASGDPVYSARKRPLQPGFSVGVIRHTLGGVLPAERVLHAAQRA